MKLFNHRLRSKCYENRKKKNHLSRGDKIITFEWYPKNHEKLSISVEGKKNVFSNQGGQFLQRQTLLT